MAAVDGVDFSGVTAPYVHLIIFVTRGLFYFGAENVQGRKGTSRLKTCKAIGHPPSPAPPPIPMAVLYGLQTLYRISIQLQKPWILDQDLDLEIPIWRFPTLPVTNET